MAGSVLRRIAVLVKQVPIAEELRLGPDGRLVRDDVRLELNPHCRRAVSKGCELAREWHGRVVVLTLGPPGAQDCLREAVAWGADEGILISGDQFAGSDTYATARALHAAVLRTGPYDLVLVGRNSVDSDTGQVGPAVAELLGWPFLHAARVLDTEGETVRVVSQLDDGEIVASAALPAVVACAERLCEPAKADIVSRNRVDAGRIRVLSAADLGAGPWGAHGSLTRVGVPRLTACPRSRITLTGPLERQVATAVDMLCNRGALQAGREDLDAAEEPVPSSETGWPIFVLAEPGRNAVTRELLGEAAALGGPVTCLDAAGVPDKALSGWGADSVVDVSAGPAADQVATAAVPLCAQVRPRAVLIPGTAWGREVASRLSVRCGAGLTGDAVRLEAEIGGLVAWKSAFSGGLVVPVTATTELHLVTVRPGVLARRTPRPAGLLARRVVTQQHPARVRVHESRRDDDIEALGRARVVIGVGRAVDPTHYAELEPLRAILRAEIAASRKVTDQGWLPHARQVGITGRSIAPVLYVALGVSGKFNHMAGVQRAATVLAINRDPAAPVFAGCDIGIVGDWREVVPLLTDACAAAVGQRAPA